MDRRNFLIITGGFISSFFGVKCEALAQSPETIPFPTELGRDPLRVPASMRGFKNIFPVPPGYYVRAKATSNCEDQGVSRDASIKQWYQDGRSPVQTIITQYRRKDDTGVTRDEVFAPLNEPTWITTEYTRPDIQSSIFKVVAGGAAVIYDVSYHAGEGVFHIVYSKDKDLLRL